MVKVSAATAVAAVLCLLLSPVIASAEPVSAPRGPVVLTVTGAVSNVNRGPMTLFDDAFFKISDVTFDHGVAFDLAMLENLGMQRVTVKHADWPSEITLEGPRLSEILDAAGATGSQVTVEALDGYQADLTMREIRDQAIILAVKRDARYLGIGGRGPGWLIFPGDAAANQNFDETRWVWSVYRIDVQD